MKKLALFKIKGMNRDLSASSFNAEFAFENKNIRIYPTNESTLLSVVNEKGTKPAYINNIGYQLLGIPLGLAIINNKLILFTRDPTLLGHSARDYIYKIWLEDEELYGLELYSGQLGFDIKKPIETLVCYENDKVQKVYWTDGFNQPRVINVEADDTIRDKWNDESFDFIRRLSYSESVSITKEPVGSGLFAAGTILYCFTYFNKYGLESNIFYASPIYYISNEGNGSSPDSTVGNTFNIAINNVDSNFDFVRIYSIHRTSLDSIPTVKVVSDLSVGSTLSFSDNGTQGYTIDPILLLYVGGEMITAGTMALKDNTLFLGNISLTRPTIPDSIRTSFKGLNIGFYNRKRIPTSLPKGSYSYKNLLSKSSSEITTFKYLEWYRFGLLFLHYTGKWSEPIFIGDYQNTVYIADNFLSSDESTTTQAELTVSNSSLILLLKSLGYIRVRPIVVYPSLGERSVICLGILCPTVFNVQDRYTNSPFALSSWFARPNAPFDADTNDYSPLFGGSNPSPYSRGGVMGNNKRFVSGTYIETINKGAWAEFRHLKPIPSNNNRNAEIQCIYLPQDEPTVVDTSESSILEWVGNNKENYYIDLSIVTLHSPDIEFDDSIKNLDTSGLKLRIVGLVPLTACASDIDIQTSTTVEPFHTSTDTDKVFTELPVGFYKEFVGTLNGFGSGSLGDSHYAFRELISGPFWFDELSGVVNNYANPSKLSTAFVVYPWHRNGSLNNCKHPVDGYRPSMLKYKKMSNIRYSYKTKYLGTSYIWNAYVEGDSNKTGISGVSIFNSDTISTIRIPAPLNSNLPDINYYGNIDKVEVISRQGVKADGYPIRISDIRDAAKSSHYMFVNNYDSIDLKYTDLITGFDPVSIKYKSTPHAVIALNYTEDGKNVILPTIQDLGVSINTHSISGTPFYSKDLFNGIYQDSLSSINIKYGFLWLGELYRDIDTDTIFGGKSDEAIKNNQWIPCGEPVNLVNQSGVVMTSFTLKWTLGDTYYLRYDHIKTYPFTLEDQNSVTEIISFMCETRINIDGRYDKNRGLTSNLYITPNNFNKLNPVYSLKNNFFTYRGIDSDMLKLNAFPNLITWTKTKTVGEIIDSWTNINLSSTIDLDGDKGKVEAIRRFNNYLISFLDRGISAILYNEYYQLPTNNGVPIEIANSGKVNGKRYITNRVGCSNKWSICESQSGIYFTDDVTKGIYLYNGNLVNITDKFGFHSWINTVSKSIGDWNPTDFNNMVSYQDKVNGDIFFITKDQCLAFSEPLGGFSSFYSYENTPFFCNLLDKGIFIKADSDTTCRLWLHNDGDYNMFFGLYQPFYTTIIVNPDIMVDKTFNNVEFTSDTWDSNGNLLNDTFDNLNVWTEYQQGSSVLLMVKDKPSTLKKKFRVWRANIPRDKSNNRDRMRNTWLYLKLSKLNYNTNKTMLHSIVVDYLE